MDEFLIVALAGFCASFVDGALGMGFGATSSTLLLGAGLSPRAVSTTVNLAKVVTGIAAAISHWRFGNVDRALLVKLSVTGCLGVLGGVALLSVVSPSGLKPVLAVLLSLIGVRILIRFSKAVPKPGEGEESTPSDEGAKVPAAVPRGTVFAGFAGGLTNGLIGAWGPVVTPFLLHRGVTPRLAIGTANTSEVFVAALSVVTLISSVGQGTFDVRIVLAMLVGGVLAAPVAAWVIRYVPARPMGIATAAVLLLTNARELISVAGIQSMSAFVYGGLLLAVALAMFGPKIREGLATRAERAPSLRV